MHVMALMESSMLPILHANTTCTPLIILISVICICLIAACCCPNFAFASDLERAVRIRRGWLEKTADDYLDEMITGEPPPPEETGAVLALARAAAVFLLAPGAARAATCD